MIAEADIQNMSTAEKLETISRIWDSLEENVEAPAWHQEILEERLKRIDAGEETFYTLDQAWAKLEELKMRRQS